MQLVCPACAARYLISPTALGEEGKDVRCAKCEHQWFERPDAALAHDIMDSYVDKSVDDSDAAEADVFANPQTDNVLDNDLDDDLDDDMPSNGEESEKNGDSNVDLSQAEDIPEGVKPKNEGANVPALAEDVIRPPMGRLAKMTGLLSAFTLFAMVIVGGLAFKKQIISAWVPAAAIYEAIGMPVDFQGKELVIENLSAQSQRDVDGKNFLLLQGRIINLTNEAQPVPNLYARLRSTNGVDVDKGWEIVSPLDSLAPGESVVFQSDFPALPDGVGSVNLSFVPTVK